MARACLGNSPLGLAQDHQVANTATLSRREASHKRGPRKRTRAVAAATARLAFLAAIG